MKKLVATISLISLCYIVAYAQNNYEIEVYESPLVPEGATMAELHSIYTLNGIKDTVKSVLPDHHALH